MPGDFKGYCSTCALRGLKAPEICGLDGRKVKEDSYCDMHRRGLVTCEICGIVILSDGIIDNGHLICQKCYSGLNTCNTCRFVNTCAFDTDPSPLPKAIQKQVRQGNMSIVTQVMNPERVRITCEKGCKCYDTKNGCLKQNGSCANCEVKYND